MRNNYGQPTWGKVHGLVDEDFLSYTLSLAVAEVRRLSETGVLRLAKPKGEADKLVLYRLSENVQRFIAHRTGERYRSPVIEPIFAS